MQVVLKRSPPAIETQPVKQHLTVSTTHIWRSMMIATSALHKLDLSHGIPYQQLN
jgi:hypothetical protein